MQYYQQNVHKVFKRKRRYRVKKQSVQQLREISFKKRGEKSFICTCCQTCGLHAFRHTFRFSHTQTHLRVHSESHHSAERNPSRTHVLSNLKCVFRRKQETKAESESFLRMCLVIQLQVDIHSYFNLSRCFHKATV